MPAARFGTRDALFLVVVLVAASATRAGYLLQCADDPGRPPPVQVQDDETALDLNRGDNARPTDRDLLVENLREARWYGGPAPLADIQEKTAYIAPGYCWLVAWLAAVQGDAELTTRSVRWIQCVLAIATVGLYFLFARLQTGSVFVALVTGLLAAMHPFWIVNCAELQDGTLATFLLAACLFLGTAASQRSRPASSLLLGFMLAGLALVRAALLPYAFVACLWFLLRCRSLPRGWLCALLVFLGFANGLTPWLARNVMVFGDVVPVTDAALVHLWIGNNDKANGGPQNEQTLRAALPPEHLRMLLAEPNQARRYRLLAGDLRASVEDDQVDTLEKRLRAGVCFLFGQAWLKRDRLWHGNGALPEWAGHAFPLALAVMLLVMVLFAPLGWRWSYGYRREASLASLALIWIPLPYVLGHADHYAGPRLPLDGVLLYFTAFALAWMLPPVARLVVAQGNEQE